MSETAIYTKKMGDDSTEWKIYDKDDVPAFKPPADLKFNRMYDEIQGFLASPNFRSKMARLNIKYCLYFDDNEQNQKMHAAVYNEFKESLARYFQAWREKVDMSQEDFTKAIEYGDVQQTQWIFKANCFEDFEREMTALREELRISLVRPQANTSGKVEMPPYVPLLDQAVVTGLMQKLSSTFGMTQSADPIMETKFGGNDWPYHKFEKIGSGQHGVAYQVVSKLDQEYYVAKAKRARTLGMKAIKEWAALVNMSHPNIVMGKESFYDDRNGFIIMITEYCSGGDLRDAIREKREKDKVFTEEEVINYLAQACRGLAFAHTNFDNEVLHLDLKP